MNLLADKDSKTSYTELLNRTNYYFSIPSFYDSHLHLLGLGKYHRKKNLNNLKNLEDLKAKIINLNNEFLSSKSSFSEGFGLRKSLLSDLTIADQIFEAHNLNNINFYWILEDGHQLLVHGPILQDFFKKHTNKDVYEKINKTCIFKDSNRSHFETFLKSIKFDLKNDLESNLIDAQNILIKKGVTHCRDLTSDIDQISTLLNLEENNKYLLSTETFFSDFFGEKFEFIVEKSVYAKSLTSRSKLITHKGVKVFVDGTFSQCSVDTQCYHKIFNNHQGSAPIIKHNKVDLTYFIKSASDSNLEIAFHTIGDRAVERVIEAFDSLKNTFNTTLHLEHCEIMNSKTLEYLSSYSTKVKSRIHFHFQPSHYAIDKEHLDKIVSLNKSLKIFPWLELKKLGYNVFFGSDAPVTTPGLDFVFKNEFMDFFKNPTETHFFWSMFSHPNYRNHPLTYTQFNHSSLNSVYIDGKKFFIRTTLFFSHQKIVFNLKYYVTF